MVATRATVAVSLAFGIATAPTASALATCAANVPTSASTSVLGQRPITTEELVRLRDIGGFDSSLFSLPSPLALSPNGREIAFIVNQADPATNGYCRSLMVAMAEGNAGPRVIDTGGELVPLKYEVRGMLVEVGYPDAITPAWSPDGHTIGYLRRDHGITQLWRVGAAGAAALPVTHSAVDIDAWAWIDNEHVVVASRPAQGEWAKDIQAEGGRGWLYDARFAPNYGPRPQMPGNLPRHYEMIVLATGTSRPASADETAHLDIEADAPILAISGARAWLQPDLDGPITVERVHVADARGREVRCADPACAGGIVKLFWSGDGDGLFYLRREGWAKSRMAFYRWDPATGALVRLSSTSDVLLGCLRRVKHFLCLRENATTTRRIAEIDPKTGAARTIYDPNPEFAGLKLGKVERLTWTNDIGLPAWGDLVLPPEYKSGARIPLVVVQYHSDGFLRGGTGDEYPIYPLAARGFAVLSIERPPFFGAADPSNRSWQAINAAGRKNGAERRSLLSSILTGVAKVVARGIADPARIGITGLSDGASSARFALVNSRVFSAAAISQASLEPKTVMTYGGIAWAEYNRSTGYPPASEDAPAFWKPLSMALSAKDLDVPLLIQASDDEYLLALETFTALREQGKPVELYVFPDEHHVKWQPAHRLAVYDRTIDWFAFWFQGVVDPDPSKSAQFARWQAMRASRDARSGSTLPSRP